MKPYKLMGDILKKEPRDIVFNLCQYGMGNVWEWGRKVGGHSARTTGDLGLAPRSSLPGFYVIGLRNAKANKYAGPGYWNDPDYLLLGWVGRWHGKAGEEGSPTRLSGDEQYSYMSMWSLMAAPLIFSGNMTKLDDFTLNVLCNHEVIAVDQDPLGVQARIVRKDEDSLVMAKKMADGSLAVGLFAMSEIEQEVQVSWKELGIEGSFTVRDVWRQQDEGKAKDVYKVSLPVHGVKLILLRPELNAETK
jgi:alpha-galactosidase